MKNLIFLPLFLFCCWQANSQDYLQQANACFDKGDYECAVKYYNLFKELDGSKDVSVQIKKAQECMGLFVLADGNFSNKEYGKASDGYKAVLDKNPKDPNAKRQYDLCIAQLNRGTVVSSYQPQDNVTNTSPPASKNLQGVKLLLIKGGAFTMGSPESEPERESGEIQHRVTLSDFYLSEKAVTNEQYCRFLNAKGVYSNGQFNLSGYGNQTLIEAHEWGVQYANGVWQPSQGKSNYPVVNVSWYGAKAYCDWAGGRLPTEAEWEYACRAGTTTPFNTGRNLTTSQANYNGNYPYDGNTKGKYLKHTQPVGSYAPNDWGLYEMHGNVWEWCSDWYDSYSSNAQTNPQGPSSGNDRVFRGGCWYNHAHYCRSSLRIYHTPDLRNCTVGFRLACSSN